MYVYTDGTITELDQTLDEVCNELKGKIIMYLITNHNIDWLSDELEMRLYEIILDFIQPYIMGRYMSG